jgi:hypothetical protein
MLASFLELIDFNAVSWEGVKCHGRASQRRDMLLHILYVAIACPRSMPREKSLRPSRTRYKIFKIAYGHGYQ